jgi:hypothetical protein
MHGGHWRYATLFTIIWESTSGSRGHGCSHMKHAAFLWFITGLGLTLVHFTFMSWQLSRPDSSSLDEKTEPVTLCPRIAVTETYAQKLSICKCLRAPVCLLYPWCVHWDHEAWWRAKDLVVLVISYCLIAQATEELIASQHSCISRYWPTLQF